MNEEEMKRILEETEMLLKRRNEMYGDGNISKMGEEGIIVRLTDKFERPTHLLKNKMNSSEETIEDTWKDIIGYGVIGLMVRRNKWVK